MPTLRDVHDSMAGYAGLPLGQGDQAWRDFVKEAREYLGMDPDGAAAAGVEVDEHYAEFWFAVAAGQSTDYEPASGAPAET